MSDHLYFVNNAYNSDDELTSHDVNTLIFDGCVWYKPIQNISNTVKHVYFYNCTFVEYTNDGQGFITIDDPNYAVETFEFVNCQNTWSNVNSPSRFRNLQSLLAVGFNACTLVNFNETNVVEKCPNLQGIPIVNCQYFLNVPIVEN